MATDYSDYKVDPNKESIKNEETFIPSAFIDSHKFTGVQALALKMQELILMEKGTNPAALGMGVGIRNYLFELADGETISTLVSEITSQQQTYLPTNLIKRVEVIRTDRPTERNNIFIFIHLNTIDENYTNNYFAIGLTDKVSKNENTILSEIYL
ncbi:MAG: hypothetical protein [Bacteriophage sp.]|nr:MAG: hypothetical protein [Bacteriophage sp.]